MGAQKLEALNQNETVKESPPQGLRSSKPKPLVYFVDDEVDILEVFEDCFSRKYEVRTFNSAYDLVDAVASGKVHVPALIVTDLRMAKMDGVKMLATLTALGHEVPAILMSGDLDKSATLDAMNTGFFRILEKPFDSAKLESYINELLLESNAHRIRTEVRAHVRQLTEIYQAMRLLLGQKLDDFDAVLNEAMLSSGQTESFDTVVGRLEKRLDELLKVEEVSESLRKHR